MSGCAVHTHTKASTAAGGLAPFQLMWCCCRCCMLHPLSHKGSKQGTKLQQTRRQLMCVSVVKVASQFLPVNSCQSMLASQYPIAIMSQITAFMHKHKYNHSSHMCYLSKMMRHLQQCNQTFQRQPVKVFQCQTLCWGSKQARAYAQELCLTQQRSCGRKVISFGLLSIHATRPGIQCSAKAVPFCNAFK